MPDELLQRREKTEIPDTATYGEALELWSVDRATIDTLNGQLDGIDALEEEEESPESQ